MKKNKHFIGTFKVIRDTSGKIRLIDGQHRLIALTKLMKKDSIFNVNLMVELYDIEDLVSENAVKLFKEANNCLNVKSNNLSHLISAEIEPFF